MQPQRQQRRLICFASIIAIALISAPSYADSDQPIPLDVLFTQSSFISPTLSPKGDKIAYIAQIGEHQVIGVLDLTKGTRNLIGRNSEPQIHWQWLRWANDKRLLVSSQSLFRSQEMLTKTRFRATRLMGIDIDGENDIILGKKWPRSSFTAIQYQDRILHRLPEDPKRVLMQIRVPDKRFAAAYFVNVKTGALKKAVPGEPDVTRLWADGNGRVRAGGGLIRGFVARKDEQSAFTKFAINRSDDGDSLLEFAGFNPDPNVIYVYDSMDGFYVLRQFNLTTKIFIGEPMGAPGADVKEAFDHPLTGNVMGYTYLSDKTEYVWIDLEAKAAYARILSSLPGSESIISSVTDDGKKAILYNAHDNLPPHYYLYDGSGSQVKLSPIGRAFPKLAEYTLAVSKPIEFTTRDDWQIKGYLTLPPGSTGKNLPTVILPHGGPVARDWLRYDSQVQFLASRGYAVMRINFRGSSGYGRKFRSPAYKAWGKNMQNDITDGAQWLIDQGISDPSRMAIFGTSYGGYTALMAGVRSPDMFKAIASYAGVTYLPWLESEADEGLRAVRGVFKQMDKADLIDASPTAHAQTFKTPVLLGHGDLDDRVNVRHSRRMASALESQGKAVEYHEFEDEIHGFLLQENRLRWYRSLEKFLDTHIGPKQGSASAVSADQASGTSQG